MALSGLGVADKQPVSFSERSWADRIFAKVLIDFNAAVVEVHAQQRPQVQDIIDRQVHAGTGPNCRSSPTASGVVPLLLVRVNLPESILRPTVGATVCDVA